MNPVPVRTIARQERLLLKTGCTVLYREQMAQETQEYLRMVLGLLEFPALD